MIQWKQRLYAFLLQRVLGPFLDASAHKKLHDSIDFSIQEGKFILKDVSLNAEYLSQRLLAASANGGNSDGPSVMIRKATVQRLEICLSLRENNIPVSTTGSASGQSSWAWRAMKLGGGSSTGESSSASPAVSLIAEIHVQGVELELVPCDANFRQQMLPLSHVQTGDNTESSSAEPAPPSAKSMIGSYVDAALSSLMLTLKLSNIHLKMCYPHGRKETWAGFKLSSVVYKDLDLQGSGGKTPTSSSASKLILNKILEVSNITIQAGEEDGVNSCSTVVAMAQGTGRVYFRMIEYALSADSQRPRDTKTIKSRKLSQDIEVSLNHQLNFSLDQTSLGYLQSVADSLEQTRVEHDQDGAASLGSSTLMSQNSSSRLRNPLLEDDEADHEDLKAITGIMKQYRAAYHLAENNQLRGGILVPSHAYTEDLEALEEDDAMTFDVFFDANEQSFYDAASVLKESVLMMEHDEEGSDSVQTKIRMHLLAACVKINFQDPSQRHIGPQEYILLTMDDLNISLSSTPRRSDIALNVAHFEIEDAQLEAPPPRSKSPGIIDIGSLLGFTTGSTDSDEYDNDMLVSHAPCITVHAQISKEQKSRTSVECSLTLLPIQVTVRLRSLANLANFASKAAERLGGGIKATSVAAEIDGPACEERQITFLCKCPSVAVSMPLTKHITTTPLFNRCGETLVGAPIRGASLGFTLDSIEIKWSIGGPQENEKDLESSATFSFYHMLVFACAPVGDKVTVGAKMQRTDIVLVNGRTEVNPFIPISLELIKRLPSSKDGIIGRESFPIVPTISSFKARQEDEDEELSIDRLLFSKLEDVESNTRDELRGTDPQIAMITESEKSDVVLRINVPEIIMDLTKAELATVIDMIEAAKPDIPAVGQSTEGDATVSREASKPLHVGLAVNVDQISCSLKQDFFVEDLYGGKSKKDRFSCLFAVNTFRSHILLHGKDMRHLRVLVHDMGVYHASHPRIDAEVRRSERAVIERVGFLKNRIRVYKEALVTPVLYRSQIFTPICQDAPSLLIDIRDTGSTPTFFQRQVNLTLYHLTLRYNVDSEWVRKVKELLPETPVKTTLRCDTQPKEVPSMTRLFLSVADCNFDYTSPGYFETASRSIVRLGDLRFSSNVMVPASRNQAYSLSLGDLSYHVTNQRLSYGEEDTKLCRAPIIMSSDTFRSGRGRKSSIHGTTAEALMREMDFVEVLSLDSMDAVIALTNWDKPGRIRQPEKDPCMTTSLTFGLLSITACKDSFNCFANTIGELQAKLTALTDDDIIRMRDDDAAAASERHLTLISPPTFPSPQIHRNEHAGHEKSDPFLLDGYEWTEIDHDPLPELEIPDGDEQVTGWYANSSRGPARVHTASSSLKRLPDRIIHHHFPLYSFEDPMGGVDMGATRHAGEGANLSLKSRLLVHKLTVKLRFFDGFDWPGDVSDKQKNLMKKKGSFVIEPIPRAEAAKIKEALSKKIAEKLEEEYGAPRMKRKIAIMADLLASNGKEEEKSPFEDTPLPEERAKTIQEETETRRLSRKTKLYLQVSANGVTVRMDAFEKSKTHRLASVMSLSISDMFVAETASLSYPVKMLGEWVNENEHPRDTRFGTLMMKMVTWKPKKSVTEESEVASDECEVSLQLLPMRVILDQRAIQFARAFFHTDDVDRMEDKWSSRLHLIPPARFLSFRVRPWKLKVDYVPQKLDVTALREGSIVELINISPIDGMVITLSQVSVDGVVGFGEVMAGLTGSWLQEVVSTQLHKFLANARPFEPISDVSQGVSDLVVLPYEAFKNGDDVRRAMGSGIKSLAETVTFQALTTTSRLTEYAANKMAAIVGGRYHNSAANPLPARPTAAPKGVRDVTGHAMESLARGFQAANYKIVIVPYREYSRHGAAGAATSILRGIPVMLVAPMTGATEALSYTLLGARNALRPDIRREEEASRTGFTTYDV